MNDDFWAVPALDSPLFRPLPEVKAGLILMDVPWDFKAYVGSGTPHRTDEDHYATVTIADLKTLDIPGLAAKDCALVMWYVGAHLLECLDLAAHWGFTYKTDLLDWVKIGKTDPAVRPISMGYWSRKQTEKALLFTRGRPKRLDAGVRQLIEAEEHVIFSPKREHSRKPEEQYDRLGRLVDGPYVELFARPWPDTARPDYWHAWGNEMPEIDYGGL